MEKYPHYLERLQEATRKYWDKAALNTLGGVSYTYGQMATQIEKFHLVFDKLGIKKGEKIALYARNGACWGMAYLAVNTYETVIVPLLADFTPENASFLVNHSESIGLFTNEDKFKQMDLGKMPELKFAVDVDTWSLLWSATDEIAAAFAAMEDLFAAKWPKGYGPQDVVFPTDNWDKLSTINYTSGSTGDPKGVMLIYRNFSSIVDYSQRHVPAGDKMVSMLPMAHMYGLVIEFIYPLCNGTAIYWLGKAPTPATLLKAFAEVKPYLLITVPLVMEKIYKSKIKPTLDKPAVKFLLKVPGLNQIIYKKVKDGLVQAFGGNVQEFIMGGAALNPEVERIFKKIKFPYLVGYGMTEACPLLAYEHWTKYVPGSCGKPVDCATVRIDSEDPEHIAGEIQAKGENITIGYFKNPEASANAFTEDGFLRTGDLGIMDKEGNIFIKGRSKSMILTANGQNVYPEELEAIVNNQPCVSESVVVDRAGKIVALVYLDKDAIKAAGLDDEAVADLPEKIRTGANRQLPNYSKIAQVETVLVPFEKTPKMSIKRFLYK
ncbi:MAG: AMP-binding protein [Bacteroidales bacterium]|nr:AMP-binding protein [Bacteroidales bacterium]MBR1578568.1 AMP-binding protein [Bacteroidales bacterium]